MTPEVVIPLITYTLRIYSVLMLQSIAPNDVSEIALLQCCLSDYLMLSEFKIC